eukprot:sb/3468934/
MAIIDHRLLCPWHLYCTKHHLSLLLYGWGCWCPRTSINPCPGTSIIPGITSISSSPGTDSRGISSEGKLNVIELLLLVGEYESCLVNRLKVKDAQLFESPPPHPRLKPRDRRRDSNQFNRPAGRLNSSWQSPARAGNSQLHNAPIYKRSLLLGKCDPGILTIPYNSYEGCNVIRATLHLLGMSILQPKFMINLMEPGHDPKSHVMQRQWDTLLLRSRAVKPQLNSSTPFPAFSTHVLKRSFRV